MARIIKLTESDLSRIVRRVLLEQDPEYPAMPQPTGPTPEFTNPNAFKNLRAPEFKQGPGLDSETDAKMKARMAQTSPSNKTTCTNFKPENNVPMIRLIPIMNGEPNENYSFDMKITQKCKASASVCNFKANTIGKTGNERQISTFIYDASNNSITGPGNIKYTASPNAFGNLKSACSVGI